MKCFLFLVFCCIPFSFFAKNVDVITAEKIAKFVLTGVDTQTRSNEIDVSLIWTGEDVCTRMNNSPAYYVFSRPLKSILLSDIQQYNYQTSIVNLQVFVSLGIETCRFL